MSKNTNIAELINYISVNGSGDIVMTGNLIMPGGAQAATQTYVTTAISNLVASSPATLDTLNELALALGSDPNFATTVATSIGTKQPQLNGTGFVKVTGTTVSYDNSTYLTTGTASSTYVPYTGATASVDLGAFLLTASGVDSVGYLARGSGTLSGYLILKQGTTFLGNVVGYNSINANSTKYTFISDVDGTNYKQASFELGSLTNNTARTYTLPNANGTIALTSDIPSVSGVYLPLAGGTLTGPLSINYGGGHFTLIRSTFNTFSFGTGIGSGISGLVVSDVTAGTNPLIIAQTTGNATFSGEVSVGSSLVLSAANPFIYGGTAAGGVGISNIGGQSYIKIYGASHATLANVTQFVNGSSTSFTISSAGVNVYAGADATSNLVLWGQTIRNEGNGAATGYGAGLKLKLSSDGEPYKWAGITAVAGTGYSNRTDLALYTAATSTANATEKVRITGDGSFGIGTNAPARTFHVMGQAAFDMTSTGVVIQSNGTVSEIVSYKQTGSTYADLHLRGANLGIAIKASTGYVGVGTNSPSGCFHVYQSAASDIYLETGTGGTSGKLIFKTSDNGDLNKYIAQEAYYMMFSSNANEGFKWRDSNSNVLMALFGSNHAYGNRLGIGTTTPSANLHVNANSGLLTKDILTVQGGGSPSGNFGFSVKANNGDKMFYTDNLTYNVFSNTAGGKFGIGTTDFSDIAFGSSALKIGGSRATLGLTSSGTLSTIALVASNNTATGMHLNFENTGAFRWYSYVSAGETFSLLGNGRLGLGVPSPDARLHVGGPILVSNNSQTYRRAITCHGLNGSFTQIKVHFNKSGWGSVAYDIKLGSAGGSHHTAGAYYSNPGIGSHVNSINAGTGITMTFVAGSQTGDTQGATWTFTGATFIHPILTIDIGCGNGYQVNPDDIVVVFT